MPMGKDSLNIVFVGSVINKQDLKFFSDASIAGNKMQLGFITGFQQNGVQFHRKLPFRHNSIH